jgi:hypothetical protein
MDQRSNQVSGGEDQARAAAPANVGHTGHTPAARPDELTAERWFERGVEASDLDTQLLYYGEAIQLSSDLQRPTTTGVLLGPRKTT